jgi:hypothetical protein
MAQALFENRKIQAIEHHVRKPFGALAENPFYKRGLYTTSTGPVGRTKSQVSADTVRHEIFLINLKTKHSGADRYRELKKLMISLEKREMDISDRIDAKQKLANELLHCEGISLEQIKDTYGLFVTQKRAQAGLWHMKSLITPEEAFRIAMVCLPKADATRVLKQVYGKKAVKELLAHSEGSP